MLDNYSIEVNQISKLFKSEISASNHVLKDVSFSLEKGKTLALIGRNGTGKTTLLKIIADIIKPSSGEVKIKGNTAAIIDIDGFFERDLTGRENVFLFLKMNGWKTKEIQSILEEIKTFSGINDYFERAFKTYSKGMQSRLILSTALQLKAEIFLIDEVFFAGDAGFISQLEKRKNELSEKGTSFIIATHNPEEVKLFADECIWLNENKIQQKGTPELVLESYNKFIVQELSKSKNGNLIHISNENLSIGEMENEFVKEVKIEFVNEAAFSYHNGFELQIEYKVLNKDEKILPGLHVLDYNKRILCISTAHNSIYNKKQSKDGKNYYKFQFPKETLIKGNYFIEIIFLKSPFSDLPHLEEVLKYPILFPLTIHPDETIVFGEDDPSFPLNLKATWKSSED